MTSPQRPGLAAGRDPQYLEHHTKRVSRLDGADGDPAPSAGALELLRRVTEALPPGEAGSLRDLLHADVVSDVQRLAVRGTGTRDEVDAEIVGELLAGVYARTLALVAEARAEVPRG